ncbi:MAG: L-threonylcarbamoyladenylate synthase [Termitinemataceae bacterium]
MAELRSISEEDLAYAGRALAEGRLVAFPTETVYGLGADATNPLALARVFEAKRRPTFDPLIVHIPALDWLDRVADLSQLSQERQNLVHRLADSLWPGPLTLILPKRVHIPDLVTSGLPTVAVRLPAHPVARRLIELAGCPVAAPSANPFGYISPTQATHVMQQLGDRIDIVIDGGSCPVGLESTVLDMNGPVLRILRPGGMSRERIEAIAGPVEVLDRTSRKPNAPGQLPSHYAPRAPLELFSTGEIPHGRYGSDTAILFFSNEQKAAWLAAMSLDKPEPIVRVLSPSGTLVEAAANLFAMLHELDTLGVQRILAERVPDRDLGIAINDRLYKARGEAKTEDTFNRL